MADDDSNLEERLAQAEAAIARLSGQQDEGDDSGVQDAQEKSDQSAIDRFNQMQRDMEALGKRVEAMEEVSGLLVDRNRTNTSAIAELAQVKANLTILNKKMADVWPRRPQEDNVIVDGCSGGSSTMTVIAPGSGLTAATDTYTFTGSGTVKTTEVTRVYWDATGDVLYFYTRDKVSIACSVSAETQHTVDTPTDCPP